MYKMYKGREQWQTIITHEQGVYDITSIKNAQ